jgi:hypothetical protein
VKKERKRDQRRARKRERDTERQREWITIQIEGMAYINIIYSIEFEWFYVNAMEFSIGTKS